MRIKKVLWVILLMLILIPFKVEAKDYKLMISYFSNGGTVSSGNVEIISGVIFVKNDVKSDITYTSSQTIKHINSLDGKTTFTLKKGNVAQTKTKEWYAINFTNGKKVYFNNAKSYTVKELVKMLSIDTSYYEQTQNSLEIYLQANYEKAISVDKIELNSKSIKMKQGKTATLTATISPSNATDKSVTWSSENTSIATVDSKGNITAVKAGTTNIVAKTNDGGKVAKCKITVEGSTTSSSKIEITSYPSNIIVGDTKTLTAKITPTQTKSTIKWSSSDTKIATIDQNGKLKAIKEGTVKITASSGSLKTTVSIVVEKKSSYKAIIKYNTNNGKLAEKHSSRITESNGIILLDKSETFLKYDNTKVTDLANYNNPDWINIVREGYKVIPEKEWNTKPDGTGKSYNQAKKYQATDFCDASKSDCTVTLYVNWVKINKVSIRYNINGGTLVSHASNISLKDSNIYCNNSIDCIKKEYNEVLNSQSGLSNYDNPDFIKIEKEGYIAKPGAEWNTKPDGTGKSFDQSNTNYKMSDFCDVSNDDCIVTLYVNWVKIETEKQTLKSLGTIKPSNMLFKAPNPTYSGVDLIYAQGFAKAKDYYVVCKERNNEYAAVMVYNSKGKHVKTSYLKNQLGHCNDMTYNSKTGEIYTPGNKTPNEKVKVFSLDSAINGKITPQSISFYDNNSKGVGSSGIAYDSYNGYIYIARGASILVFNSDHKYVRTFNKIQSDTPQGIGSYKGRVLVIRFKSSAPAKGTITKTKNAIDIYRSEGYYLGSYIINTDSELEAVDYSGSGNKFLLFFANGSLYQVDMDIPQK